jgi:hypothetical protein
MVPTGKTITARCRSEAALGFWRPQRAASAPSSRAQLAAGHATIGMVASAAGVLLYWPKASAAEPSHDPMTVGRTVRDQPATVVGARRMVVLAAVGNPNGCDKRRLPNSALRGRGSVPGASLRSTKSAGR